jgi:hypothetical protein
VCTKLYIYVFMKICNMYKSNSSNIITMGSHVWNIVSRNYRYYTMENINISYISYVTVLVLVIKT